MAYILQHTAEEIDHKLSLIDENKNLLPYPYEIVLPTGLIDVGDGSILTTKRNGAYSEESFLLNHCELPAGKYTISLDITTVLEEPTVVSGFALKVEIAGQETIIITDQGELQLTEESTVVVHLVVPSYFDAGLIIKPQIEKGEEKTIWVPNMDKIGTYVDRRFNSTNVKIKETITKVNESNEEFEAILTELTKLTSEYADQISVELPSE